MSDYRRWPKGKEAIKQLRRVNEVIDSGLWGYLRKDVKEWYTAQTGQDYSKPCKDSPLRSE